MTHPNEADAKEVARKLLEELKGKDEIGLHTFIPPDAFGTVSSYIKPRQLEQVCTRLLELEEHKLHYDRLFTSGVLIPSKEYAAQVKDRDTLKAEVTRLLELEERNSERELEHAIWEKTSLVQIVKERDDLKAELKAANERRGKLERALQAILSPYTESSSDIELGCGQDCWCDKQIARKALRSQENEKEK